jgi:hypothetical protein
MGKEHIVSLRDESGQDLKLDLTNGYVYDSFGNTVSRWSPKEDTATADILGMCADSISEEASWITGAAMRSAVTMKQDSATGRTVLMDLGIADVHQASPMSNYAAGYRNGLPMADVYAPPLMVAKPSDKYYTFDKGDAFQVAAPIAGGPAGQVDEISPRLANATYTTLEYAVGGFVATQLQAAADAPLNIRKATARRCMQALMLRREARVNTLATTTGNWDSTLLKTVSAGSQWNGGASADPIKDLQDRCEASYGDVTGILMNERVFHAFQRSPAVQKFFTYKDGKEALPDPGQMSAILQLPPIYVAKMKYINTSGALDYIWSDKVILFRQPAQMPPTTQDDVSTGTTFRWQAAGVDGASQGGFIVREYFVQDRGSLGGNKVVVVHQDAEVQTSAYVGGLISSVIQ